jgi:hypothetical protein
MDYPSLPPGALPEPKTRLSSVVTPIGLLKAFSESNIEWDQPGGKDARRRQKHS